MFDLITIGNIGIDFYFKGDSLTHKENRFQFAVGGKYVADFFYQGIGGGGANVAIGASKNGLRTAVLANVGENIFKKLITQKLNEERVSYRLCQIEKNYIHLSSIFLSSKGERSIINYESPNQHIIEKGFRLKSIIDTKALYLGNLFGVSLEERCKLIHYAKKNKILTFMNLGVKDCRRSIKDLKKLLEAIDVLIVNGYEFADLVKTQYKDLHFKENVVRWYAPYLSDKVVVITEGAKGSYVYSQEKVYYQTAITPNKIVDTTGAGDGYTAGFISEYMKHGSIQKAMEKGASYASKILAKIGAN